MGNRQMKMTLHQQNTMLAVRTEMGWPPFKPANDSIAFSSGKTMSFAVGKELARIAQMLGKDVIYSGWANIDAPAPAGFTVAYREMFGVAVIDGLVPYAANDQAAIILVSTRADEFFAVDERGSLVRVPGKPKDVSKGRKLALKRIMATAASKGDEMLESNRWVPAGARSIALEAPAEAIVRFD